MIMEEFLDSQINCNKSFITMNEDMLQEAIKLGNIYEVGRNPKNKNTYYEVAPDLMLDTILINVIENKFIVTDRHLKYSNYWNNSIDAVEILKGYSLCVKKCGGNRERVFWNVPDKLNKGNLETTQLTVERILISYAIFGGLVKLDDQLVIHHNSLTWDNRIQHLWYISKHAHNEIGNKSRLKGKYIDSEKALKDFFKELNGR
ncbi:hypothetical protein [Clostridium sp.]|uniref:hypothetical protein n=1 Tax=Clostridium sp. TaxID=1506 RepID=UPI003D6D4028